MHFPTDLLIALLLSIPWTGRLVADSIPVAPLQPEETEARGEVYQLETEWMTAVVSPSEGGVVSITTPATGELLAAPFRVTPLKTPADKTWEHRGWMTSEETRVVMLSRSLGPPLSLRIVHIIEIPADGSRLQQETRITATGPGDQSLLQPTASWRVPAPEDTWTRLGDDPDSNCGGWIRVEPLPGKFSHPVLTYPDLATSWRCAWSLEEPEIRLSTALRIRGGDDAHTFTSKSGTPDLPARGWTLICRFTLELAPIEPETGICAVLKQWPILQ